MLHYNFPPFSVGETGRIGAPGRREIGHGKLAWRAIRPMLPSKEEFPYTCLLYTSDVYKRQAVLLRGRDASIFRGMVQVACSGQLVAIAEVERGEIIPKRVFNLTGVTGRAIRQKVGNDVAFDRA